MFPPPPPPHPLSISSCPNPLLPMNMETVPVTFRYLVWDDLFYEEKPFEILTDIPKDAPDQRKTNLTFTEGREELVVNCRGIENNFSLDTHGFSFHKHKSALTPDDFHNRQEVESTYLPECEELLRKLVQNVDQVFFYNWRLRCSSDEKIEGSVINFSDPTSPLGAAVHVHVDQSPSSIVERIEAYLPEQASHLLRGRVQHINIWRPIDGPVEDYPLALCDGRSMPSEMLVETNRISRQFSGDSLFAMYQDGYRWHYLESQRDDELLVFKSFDSEPGVAGCSCFISISITYPITPI